MEQNQCTSGLGQTVQLQHPPAGQVMEHSVQQGQITAGSILESQILQQSSDQVLQQTQPPVASINLGQGQVVQAQSLATFNSPVTVDQQQTLHHVNPPHPAEYQQQMLEASHTRSATVVIQHSLLESGPAQQQQQAGTLVDAQNAYQLQHLDAHSTAHDQHTAHHNMQELESIAQQVLVHPTVHQSQASDHFTTQSTQYAVSASNEDDGVQLQNIPENESISRSISPITANLPPTTEDYVRVSLRNSSGGDVGATIVMSSPPLSHPLQSQLLGHQASCDTSAQCETQSFNCNVAIGTHAVKDDQKTL